MVGVFRVLGGLEETGRVAMAVVKGISRVAMMMVKGPSRVAVVVAVVLVVGTGVSVKVDIDALDSEKGSSNFLILNCFLLAWCSLSCFSSYRSDGKGLQYFFFLPNISSFCSLGIGMDGPVNPMGCLKMFGCYGTLEGVDPLHCSHQNVHVYAIFQ